MKDLEKDFEKDLDAAIQKLEKDAKAQTTGKKTRINIVGSSNENQNTQGKKGGQDNWDTTNTQSSQNHRENPNTQTDQNNWDIPKDEQDEDGPTIHPPGGQGGRFGRLFSGFVSDVSSERILETVLLVATIAGLLWIVFNFEAITIILAAGIAYVFIAIGKFVISIITVVICVVLVRYFWRRRRYSRRRW